MQKIEVKSLIDKNIKNFEVIGISKNSKSGTEVILKCSICGRTIKSQIYNFNRGYFHCNHGNRLSAYNCINKVFGNYEILGVESKDSSGRTLVNVKCIKCSNIKTTYFHRITSYSSKCDCDKRTDYKNYCINKYEEYIGTTIGTDDIVGFNYYSDRDHNNRSMFKLKCRECGIEREVRAQIIVSNRSDIGKKCNCKPKTREIKNPIKKYTDTVLNKRFGNLIIKDLSGGNTLQDIIATCECECGNKKFRTVLGNIVSGDTRSCGCKIKSFGVMCIEKELNRLNINYTTEQKMKDLVSSKGKHLRFDFFIKNNSDTGIAVIEFDGPHHYNPFIYYDLYDDNSTIMEKFRIIQENDKLKDEYVKAHKCKILRIKYSKHETEDSIRRIVNNFISSLEID